MITMTNEQLEKIDLLDTLFGALDVTQIKELAESEQVVAKLKGTNLNPGLLRRLVQDSERHNIEIMSLRGDVQTLRNNLQTLAKLMLKPYDYNSQTDAQTLKSSLGIY